MLLTEVFYVCLNFTRSKCSFNRLTLDNNTGASYVTIYIYGNNNQPIQLPMQSGCRGELWSSTYTSPDSDMEAQYKGLSPTYAELSCDTN